VPEAHGGAGGRFFHSVLAVEELSRVDPSVGVLVDVQNTLVINAVMHWGSDDIKRKYLPKFTTNMIGAYCLSEAGSGSDAFAMAARATETADGFTINGRKLWITNGNEADMFIVFTNVNPDAGYRGITAFIVDRGTPGFTVGKKEDKLGIRASSTCELLFEDCVVPKSQILGEVGKGYKVAIETLNEGRIGIGAQMLGLAQGALDHTVRYIKERKQFGKPIAEFQAIQWKLADMATEIDAARLLVYRAAWLKQEGRAHTEEGAKAKLFASEVARRQTAEAIQILGGYGYTKEFPVERYYRDAKITEIYEGTSEIQRLVIARHILGHLDRTAATSARS